MPLGGVIFLAVFIALFGALLIVLARAAGGGLKTGTGVKFDPYECGIPGQEKRDTKISVKFYLTAILFILFDIEIIFMYPWAITFRDFIFSGQGLVVGIAMLVFLLIFIFGLFWEIKSKALEWD
ncbi:MAG: NADH-quinone oxidoreductase subunit A [Bdellovibrionaceae bacterium]|nr:NADH-quinone oxidoreductase subunit A [Pseudobdellovibrionaceae bacterium]MBX3033633.1 NADH-quinone oxidoreductase subunit A [Pseudobdellovibrionaceae bacterium]